jgi:hypothetical protein
MLHQLLLALAVLGWAVLIGGSVYARFFVSDVAGPMAIKSPEAFTQILGFTVGWLVSAFAFAGSVLAVLFSSQQSGSLTSAAVVSGIYFFPVFAFFLYGEIFR